MEQSARRKTVLTRHDLIDTIHTSRSRRARADGLTESPGDHG